MAEGSCENIERSADTVKRDGTIDFQKMVLILLVIVGHGYIENVNRYIYWFHMPCFFLMSGKLTKIPLKDDFLKWMIKRAKELMIPYFTWGAITCAVTCFSSKNDIVSYLKQVVHFLLGGNYVGGVFWFVTALFLSQAIFVCIETYVSKKLIKIFIYVSMYLSACLISSKGYPILLPWSAESVLICVPYLAIGHNDVFSKTKRKNGLYIVAVALLVIGIAMKLDENYVMDIKYGVYPNALKGIAYPLSVYVILMYIGQCLKWGRIPERISIHSMTIMYTHLMVRDYILKTNVIHGSIVIYVISSVAVGVCLDLVMKIGSCFVRRIVHKTVHSVSD